ncbi:hypothetical protein [Thalassotalea litorea]|uniref:hypothetical protein n=1 Tax=Thalassotalea litorea TaxID=2020715 RepID=UPI0037351B42
MMKWYEPSGYALWQYKNKIGKLPLGKLAVATVVFIGCFASYALLPLDFRLENQINQLEVVLWLASGSYLVFHFSAWVIAKYDLGSTLVEITENSIYRYSENSNDSIEPEIYLNEIKSIDFELIQLKGYKFYNCHIKLQGLRSKTRDYFEFGIQKDYYDKNQDKLLSKLNRRMTAKESMSAPIKD